MPVICGAGEAEYFSQQDWTGQISLIRQDKLACRRRSKPAPPARVSSRKESYPLPGQKNVVTVKAEINGVRGLFILDTGASHVALKSAFADRAKIPQKN
jgi:hypothetical protein